MTDLWDVDENDIEDFPDDEEDVDDDDVFEFFIEDDDLEDDDLKILENTVKDVKKFINEKKITPRTYVKEKNKLIHSIKKDVKQLDLLLLAQAYLRQETFSGFIRKHEDLRKGLLKSLLNHIDDDSKIIILQDLLWEYSGDEEPVEFYIS